LQAQSGALAALGEDRREYAALMHSLENNLAEGLESELMERIVDTLWEMKRSVRMRNGLAVKRVQRGVQIGEMLAGPPMVRMYETYEGLCAIARMINREDSTPAPGEIQAQENAFGPTPPDDVRKIFPFLRAYGEAALKAPGPASKDGNPLSIEWQEREAACQKLRAALDKILMPYAMRSEKTMADLDKVQSPENVAALMAHGDDDALHMQREEDLNLRQLWRLTNILIKVRSGALA
jgi:hypothetical protein